MLNSGAQALAIDPRLKLLNWTPNPAREFVTILSQSTSAPQDQRSNRRNRCGCQRRPSPLPSKKKHAANDTEDYFTADEPVLGHDRAARRLAGARSDCHRLWDHM